MLALWLAAGLLEGPGPSDPQPPNSSPGGSLWWRETLRRPADDPVDDTAAQHAARNAEALILLLT